MPLTTSAWCWLLATTTRCFNVLLLAVFPRCDADAVGAVQLQICRRHVISVYEPGKMTRSLVLPSFERSAANAGCVVFLLRDAIRRRIFFAMEIRVRYLVSVEQRLLRELETLNADGSYSSVL